MDFMNLNQSAHGDREFGFIMTRMRLNRKVITGHWEDPAVLRKLNAWARAAAGWHDWQGAKFVRFGDNMRQVAVTEGDKVEAEMTFGYSVNTHGIGDLVQAINDTSDSDVEKLVNRIRRPIHPRRLPPKRRPPTSIPQRRRPHRAWPPPLPRTRQLFRLHRYLRRPPRHDPTPRHRRPTPHGAAATASPAKGTGKQPPSSAP